jgi:hypothetical protein
MHRGWVRPPAGRRLAAGWHQELCDPGEEADGVDRLSQHARCDDAVAAQGGNEGQCLPVPIWHLGNQALAAGAAPMRAGHVGLHPCLIDEDQTLWVNLALVLFPLVAPARDVGPVLFSGTQAFLEAEPGIGDDVPDSERAARGAARLQFRRQRTQREIGFLGQPGDNPMAMGLQR